HATASDYLSRSCLLSRPLPNRNLPSFPTRRSSDLGAYRVEREFPARALHRPSRLPESDGGELREDSRRGVVRPSSPRHAGRLLRSEEHTSELQSLAYLVCRLLLEKKK